MSPGWRTRGDAGAFRADPRPDRCCFLRPVPLLSSGPAAGAAPGLVIASPSASHPDYFYTWTRDSALTFATILRRMLPADKASEPELESLLREYVLSQAAIQLVDNPSGGLFDGGLGEPKFTVEGQAFQGSWGRPQRVRTLSLR